MKKIKVLFTGYGTNLGGIETFLFNLVENVDLKKFEFSFLVFKASKKVVFYDELIEMGCKIYEITPRSKNYFKFLKVPPVRAARICWAAISAPASAAP